ncbi:HlyD family secretion protein [Rosistilla carotiformis]|uniref:HlyD family secretion protein n=1 Tax=Rosistilla carotiformis TaxID=2528017 RepID=A0A518JX84_9BACT|nr:efflux RND transporter periplasmic adaptor subunit [Rosistilla carotiformis]QDV70167.1 HlyD family secretion protein [Rosistilla carotiformis]
MQSSLETPESYTPEAQHSCVELSGVVLTLRDDLRFTLQHDGAADTNLIEDHARTKFYRVGIAEFAFISLLDGHVTIAEAHGLAASALGAQALNDQETAGLCRWLVENQLASTPASLTSCRMAEAAGQHRFQKRLASLSLISPKLPFGNPDRAIGAISPLLGWWFSPLGFAIWMIVIGGGLVSVFAAADRINPSAETVIARNNWIWLGTTWFLLKLVHELAHGLACKRFGGSVRECGIVLFMLIPLPYVDVTSAWQFRARSRRILTSAAGVMAELMIAAIAAILWSRSTSPLVVQHAFNVMLSGSLITWMFNANPLMRFDGYYILTDWLKMPNLATHASQMVRGAVRKFFLGIESPASHGNLRSRWFVAGYGVAAIAWRVVMCTALIVGAEQMLWGAGIAMALIAATLWFILPIARTLHFIVWGNPTSQPNRRQFCKAIAIVSLLAAGILLSPWYGQTTAPAIVGYDPLIQVRAPTMGFVKRVAVRSGQQVHAGDVLLELENQPLQMKTAELAAQVQRSRTRARIYAASHQAAAYDVEQQQLAAIESEWNDRRGMLSNLIIRATKPGIVIGDTLESVLGTYVAPGESLMTLGPQGQCRIRALVPQRELEYFVARVGQTVRVQMHGSPGIVGRLESVDPRGDTRLPHAALSATAGGPIATHANRQPDSEPTDGITATAGEASGDATFEATEPYFTATIRVDDDALAGKIGATGWVGFRSHRGSVGVVLWETLHNWITSRQRHVPTG